MVQREFIIEDTQVKTKKFIDVYHSLKGEKMDKNRICIIRAKLKDDYCFDGIKKMGFKIIIPYKDYNLFLRCLRETWFRLKFPCRWIWYNTAINYINADVIILYDPLITPHFIDRIRKLYPNARIIVSYDNRVDRTISPISIVNPTIEKWSYDEGDCKRYSMHKKRSAYLDIYCLAEKEDPKFDMVYLGRDKGRAKELFALQNNFERMGLKTYFHICADRQYLRFKKGYYKPLMRYQEYLRLIAKSKSILNIMPEGQTSLTMRDFEVIFNGIKGVTNNKGIKNVEFYHPSRFFVLGEDPIEELPKFLRLPFLPVDDDILNKYRFDNVIQDMIC